MTPTNKIYIKSYVEVVVMRAQVPSEAREAPDTRNTIGHLPDTDEDEDITESYVDEN